MYLSYCILYFSRLTITSEHTSFCGIFDPTLPLHVKNALRMIKGKKRTLYFIDSVKKSIFYIFYSKYRDCSAFPDLVLCFLRTFYISNRRKVLSLRIRNSSFYFLFFQNTRMWISGYFCIIENHQNNMWYYMIFILYF